MVMQPSAEDFLEACGLSSPVVLEVEQREQGDTVRQTLALPFALIGRDERAEIRLDDPEVSQRHAYLQVVAGQVWCVDLGSRTGTHEASGDQGMGTLLGRQGVRIGPYIIRRVQDVSPEEDGSPAPANPLSVVADDPSLLPRLALEFRGGGPRQPVWLVDRPLTLMGRASFCKVRLHSPLVSRAHAALLNTSRGTWLIDLLGREGVQVNGTAVRWAYLEPEDEIQIERFRICLHCLTPPPHTLELRSAARREPTKFAEMPALSFESRRGELTPSASASPLPALVPAVSGQLMNANESLLLPLITQFSQMQQQMFDQFQQTLLLMAQTFGNLHQGQMALVRQELDQIQDLTRQLQALQLESTRQPQAPQPQPQSSLPRATPPGRLEPPPRPVPSEPSPAAPAGRAPSPTAAPTPALPRCEGDVHTWLSQRLAALQQERQSRWQKLLGMLSGK